MYIDNLTIAGLAVASITAMLPFIFGREMIRVQEDGTSATTPSSPRQTDDLEAVPSEIDCVTAPEACN
jgi:hypothetical protein